jgi:arginine exporter protein ArgO
MGYIAALGAGLLAGLALVVPLGAVGILLIREGTARGLARGIPAATAVATVDVLYCTAALTAGSVLAPIIVGWMPWPQVIGGTTLIAIAGLGLLRMARRTDEASVGGSSENGPSWRRYALFFGLTATNPATLIYFAAVVTGLTAIASSVATAALFVVGVAIASAGWQILLVAAGAALRWRSSARLRRVTTLVGNAAVALLGLVMIAAAVF